MTYETIKLDVTIRRSGNLFKVGDAGNVSAIDFGPLLRCFCDEPSRISKGEGEGTLTFSVTRNHEWELLIALVIVGTGIFCKAALDELGKRFASWMTTTIDANKKRHKPIVYSCSNDEMIIALHDATSYIREDGNINDLPIPIRVIGGRDGSYNVEFVFRQAAQNHRRVVIIVDPDENWSHESLTTIVRKLIKECEEDTMSKRAQAWRRAREARRR